MPTTPIDFAALLAPISAQEPSGKNLRTDLSVQPIYQKLKDTRIALRTAERQQLQTGENNISLRWHEVVDQAIAILKLHSKDLEVASWLIEALLREQGFSGLYSGFSLMRQLCEQFWGMLYPLPDEDGVMSLVAPLAGLNGETVEGSLITPIALTPLLPDDKHIITLWQYRQALTLFNISDTEIRTQRIAAGCMTMTTLQQILDSVADDVLQSSRNILQECSHEFQKLNLFLQEQCGEHAPPSSRILAQLEACLDCLNCGNNTTTEMVGNTVAVEQKNVNATVNFANISANSEREQILQNILHAAEFFRTVEPHSPVSYLLKRAVRWANTPLPALLKELIPDETIRDQLSYLVGIEIEHA